MSTSAARQLSSVLSEMGREELLALLAVRCKESLFSFIQTFWAEIIPDQPVYNWHIPYLCNELQGLYYRVRDNQPKAHDLIINIPPGTTKSTIVAVMFPVWCWVNSPWISFITGSYSGQLSLEHAEKSRDLIRSNRFHEIYPNLRIRRDKDVKSNYQVEYKEEAGDWKKGGRRFSTSVGGTVTGMHGHIIIVDDPLNPHQAVSKIEIETANRWIEQTLSTRKIDKSVTPTILIMQRLHQNDPTGKLLAKKKSNTKHICLPGELKEFGQYIKPDHLRAYYVDGLLDPKRMGWDVLQEMKEDLGQYGYSAQVGQNPVPPGGGMFKVEMFKVEPALPNSINIVRCVRYWDKAGTEGGGAYTVGVKMALMRNGTYFIMDVIRGQWASHERESIIKSTAHKDGKNVEIYIEQEPGSGGKESAMATIRNLAGFSVRADRPTGDKVYRADPFSVQVNNGNVSLLKADWNHEFIEEYRYFPFSTYMDQVDAGAGAFNALATKKIVRPLLKRR